MKAAVVEKFGTLVVRDIPKPKPGDYEVLCQMLFGATCTGTDQHLMGGTFPWPVSLPAVIGHESVGRVVEIGPKVRNFRLGDVITRVGVPEYEGMHCYWGGYVEFGIATDHWAMAADGLEPAKWQGARVNQIVPAAVDPRAATMFTTWRETLSFITRMSVGTGASILVVGSGGNGLSFANHAANLGAARVAMIGAERLRERSARAGVTQYYAYTDGDAVEIAMKDWPSGYDYIIDAVGKIGVADQALPALKFGGMIAIYGVDDWGKTVLTPTRARGTFTLFSGGYDESETHQRVSEFYLQGKLDASVWLDMERIFPLGDINAAFDAIRKKEMVKALVKLTE